MTDKSQNQKDSNIILYPGLVRRLLELGMDALKEKRGQSAYEYFKQAESIEPDNSKVRFGTMLSLVELGRLEEAVLLTDQLLKEDAGDYYENLQVHISLLVQLSRYEEVIEILDAVLAESQLPPQHAESLYKLLHFSRQMTEDSYLTNSFSTSLEPDGVENIQTEHLQSSSPHKQWQSIQMLSKANSKQAAHDLVQYIEDPDKDLLLRSYALQLLMKWEIDQEVHITKLEKSLTVNPALLAKRDDMTNRSDQIKQILSTELEHENPVLYELATQLLIMHLLIIFPFLPEQDEIYTYAAALHLLASERLGLTSNEESLALHYGCSLSDILEQTAVIEELEGKIFKQDDINYKHEDT